MASKGFGIVWEVVETNGIKELKAKSVRALKQCLDNCKPGTILFSELTMKAPSISNQQRRYHFALLRLVAQSSGYSVDELHDFAMRAVFGEKMVTIGDRTFGVRKSLSKDAQMPKDDFEPLIPYDQELCTFFGVVPPTLEDLGIISNY